MRLSRILVMSLFILTVIAGCDSSAPPEPEKPEAAPTSPPVAATKGKARRTAKATKPAGIQPNKPPGRAADL